MISLREMREELTGIRFGAVSHSIWNMAATINERARVAINDALRVYAYYSHETYNSLVIRSELTALPKNVSHVLMVSTPSNNSVYNGGERQEKSFKLIATPATILLETHLSVLPQVARVDYEARVQELPEDVAIVGSFAAGVQAVSVSGGIPAATWQSPGYFEVSVDNTKGREVVFYELALPTGFTNLLRGVGGSEASWPEGARISAVATMDPEAVSCIQAAAEATMFGYWIGHRSQYDSFMANAGLGQASLEELVGLVQVAEARAERRYKRTRKSLAPVIAQRG